MHDSENKNKNKKSFQDTFSSKNSSISIMQLDEGFLFIYLNMHTYTRMQHHLGLYSR